MQKASGLLGAVFDNRAKGKYKRNLKQLAVPEVKKYSKQDGTCLKDPGAKLKIVPITKSGAI